MKIHFTVLTFFLFCCQAMARQTSYTGSTPAHAAVREFLNISRTDSIDFIRWKLVLTADRYELDCSYGLCQPNTSGFSNEKKAVFSGQLKKQNHLFELQHKSGVFYIREINDNLVHMLDNNKDLLQGNGGWSYTLNNVAPVSGNQLFYTAARKKNDHKMVFEGRTPCQPLSQLIGRQSSAACNKIKWKVTLYSDPATGRPTQYTIHRWGTGSWEIITGKDGRTIYRLDRGKKEQAIHLLTADNTILLFTRPDGSPLVGNEDFSYTLSRTKDG